MSEIDRRTFLKTSLAAAAATGLPAPAFAQTPAKPNIIFFMVDQLSAKWLWGDAGKAVHTPNLDSLRARGVAFTSTCMSNPVCAPSRACLATGLRTRNHGLLQNGYELDPAIPTYMRELQTAGWKTGLFGKAHHRAQYRSVHTDYRPYGYDVVFNTEDARAGYWLDWVAKEQPNYYTQALATVWVEGIPELKAYGPGRVDLRKRVEEIRKKFRWATSAFPESTAKFYTLPFPGEVSQTEWITRNAIDFINGTAAAQPVFAQISYVQPHNPNSPPAEYMQHVDPSMIPAPAGIEWVNDPLHPRCFPTSEGAQTALAPNWRAERHYYLADVAHLDAQLGRITDALQKAGRLENTYFIMLADHGSLLLDHGFTGKGERHYDACVRVPLMIAGPGLQKGLSRNEFVQLEDVFPTVMEMAGLSMPLPTITGERFTPREIAALERYPGNSLLPLCRGEQVANWRDAVEIESYNNVHALSTDSWARTIRTKDWRYTLYPLQAGEQLFSMNNDPDEQKNLAGDPAYARVRTEMRDRLLEQIILQDHPHTQRDRFGLGVI